MDGQIIAILVFAAVGTAVIAAVATAMRRRRGRDGTAGGATAPGGGRPANSGTASAGADRDAADGAGVRGVGTGVTGRGAAAPPPLALGIVRWFRPRGFFADADGTDGELAAALEDRIRLEWGTSLEDLADDQQAADMHVLSFDEGRVYRPGAKYIHRGDGTYAEVVRRAAALAPDVFPVEDVQERWAADDGPIHVTYRLGGRQHRFTTAADRYLDPSIVLHLDLAADDPDVRLRVCDHLGMPDFVITLDDATAEALRRRGWTFWDDVAAPA